jgi:apolipoprotein D and lipocalin family protein
VPRTTARVLLAALVSVVSLLGLAAPASAATPTGPLTPVTTDLGKYVGDWNQVAAIPAFFDVFCVKDTRATYVANPDDTVGVTNRCSGPFDVPITIQGTAKVNGPADGGALQVSFLRFFGRTFYLGGTNYVVAAHDDAYTWALVGDPDRGSGFLLSRTPALTTAQWRTAFDAVVAAGYDPCRFLTTPTTGGLATKAPLCAAPVTT